MVAEISPRRYARIGGIAYLIIIIAGLAGEMFIRNPNIVSGNTMATANNIVASHRFWRIGIAGDLIMHIEPSRLFSIAKGQGDLHEEQREHLKRCGDCQRVLAAFETYLRRAGMEKAEIGK